MSSSNTPISNATELQGGCTGLQLSFKWFGLKRAVKGDEKDSVADGFHADPKALSLSKTLIDTDNETYKALVKIKGLIRKHWVELTLPWVESGTRLVRKDRLAGWEAKYAGYREQLAGAAAAFAARYESIVAEGMAKQGDLADRGDYPSSGEGLFGVDRRVVELNPPGYLKGADPALYEELNNKTRQQFERALQLAEQGLAGEFRDMLGKLAERLKPGEDGKAKILKGSTVENLKDFIARFKSLHVTSSHELDALVDQTALLVGSLDPSDLRGDQALRTQVAQGVEQIGKALEASVYVPPRRKLTRKKAGTAELPAGGTPREETAVAQQEAAA